MTVEKKLEIAKSEVSFYDFKWLDTSAISLFDTSSKFETYNGDLIESNVHSSGNSEMEFHWV